MKFEHEIEIKGFAALKLLQIKTILNKPIPDATGEYYKGYKDAIKQIKREIENLDK